jgi:hypothetical protein
VTHRGPRETADISEWLDGARARIEEDRCKCFAAGQSRRVGTFDQLNSDAAAAPLVRPFGEITCAMAICSAMERARSDRLAFDAMARNQVEDQRGRLPELLQKAFASLHANFSRDSVWPDP